jgi:outer membrane protein OmpA-like peptidoglycan-associated protein
MLLGDRNLVYEPKVALEWRPDRVSQTKVVANLGTRIRNRTVLEAYDTANPMATADDAKVFLDVGSELLAGVGGTFEITPRAIAAAEVTLFAPLPESFGYGSCRRFNGRSCRSIDSDDYWEGAKRGDLTVLATLGAFLRLSADVTATVSIGTGQVGARGDDFRISTGLVWAPQPAGIAAPGRNDHDGDGIPDSVDACPDEAEDKDGFKDGDGCPERDNDEYGVPDVADKCPNDSEDINGFEDDDGCPDEDNDGDGIKDGADKCPNDAETVNGFEDDDGCPDVRGTTGPEERADRIDLKGQTISFEKQSTRLTANAKVLLTQAATIIKNRKLSIRIEVHVALGTKATGTAAIKAQKQRDKQSALQRARAIQEFLVGLGVPAVQLQAVGIGSDRPLGTAAPTDPINDRVDLIKAQQGGAP